MNLDDIRNRAQGVVPGKVTPEEVRFARAILRERYDEGVGPALYIVGHCGDEADAELIESYLHGPERNIYGETALMALCRYLGLIRRYRPLIRQLIMSPSDIGWRHSRMTAIHLAYDYLESGNDDEVGCRLVEIFCDFADPNRMSARGSLVDILGLRNELRDPFGLDAKDDDPDATHIVNVARHRFKCGREVH